MKHSTTSMDIGALAAGLALLLGACGGGGGSHGTNGAAFVKAQITNTSDTADPVDIDALDLRFAEDTAPFDDLFQ